MVLNYIWVGLILVGFLVAAITFVCTGDYTLFNDISDSLFTNAGTGFTIALGLTGILTLWSGILKVGEKGGTISIFSKLISPVMSKLFPEVPKDNPAMGKMMMNFSANMLGLDNAATPLGLSAMEELQKINPDKKKASNAEIMFLVLNTSGLTIVPMSVIAIRAQMGVASPANVFVPILLATLCSTVAGVILTAVIQKIKLFRIQFLIFAAILFSAVYALMWWLFSLPSNEMGDASKAVGAIIIIGIIALFLGVALSKRINIFDTFIEGAKDGFKTSVKIIPYLVAMLVAIGIFRASGAMLYVEQAMAYLIGLCGVNTDFIPALPTALMKPLSGSGARGLMVETMNNYGVNSFPAFVASCVQGATDTTLYIVALYFGSVGIRNTRYAVTCGLFADFVGVIAAIIFSYMFFVAA
ncbi:MAG: nucleoside recognition domain-containing protein [Bacteroidales bacterium]